MNKAKQLNLLPYTSVALKSSKMAGELLENLLSADCELQPKKISKPIILYGAGNLGKLAKDFFEYLNLPFLYVVDKNANNYKTDGFWRKTKIIHPDDVEETDKKSCLLIICIATTPLMALRDDLKNSGWNDIAFFYDISEAYSERHPLSNGWFLGKLNENDKKSIREVFSFLADDVSRAHYVQFLAWRKLRTELLFNDSEINKDSRFFIPEIIEVLRPDEVFVDGGAHQGLVAKKFIKITADKYSEIYAIEPDNNSLEILQAQLKDAHDIKIIKSALSDKNGEEKFYQGFDFVSKLNKNGQTLKKTAALDSLKIQATFIKIHLEGGELKALQGAAATIKECRPIIAVTLYHNSDGIWKIPLFLIRNAVKYKYYLRLHSWAGTGAVFYAIPAERKTINQ
jgi:FkbM family methyltransferase